MRGKRYHRTRSRPDFEWRKAAVRLSSGIIPEYLAAVGARVPEGGVWDLNLEE